jgi:hypothetical protein
LILKDGLRRDHRHFRAGALPDASAFAAGDAAKDEDAAQARAVARGPIGVDARYRRSAQLE